MTLKTITAAAALCLAVSAHALDTIDELYWPETGRFPAYPEEPDTRTVRPFVFLGYERDSNPFRISNTTNPVTALGSSSRSDTVRRLGAGVRGDLRESRQRFLFDLQFENRDYSTFSTLDHTEYRGAGTWLWSVGNQWSGDAGVVFRRFLGDPGNVQANLRDMIRETRAFVNAGYLVTPRWRARGGLERIIWDHDQPTRAPLDARIWAATAGLDYVTPAGNSIGGQVRYSEGDYPNREIVGGVGVVNDYEEVEASAVMRWAVTGKSTLQARLGHTKREHTQVPQRDFSGATGRVDWDWFIAAKTLLGISAWREVRSTEDLAASYVLVQGWGVGPAWAPTTRLIFQARYFDEDQDYRGDPALGLVRDERVRAYRLTAGYAPLRNVHVSLGVERGDRSSNIAGRDYDYTLYTAAARLRF